MAPLSVVIITYNEERHIGRCLDSVQEVADEIVVVDSFSTDGTELICKSKGVRFVQHKFEGHIQQKNYAITQARFPHILSLDADEALSPELVQSVLNVKKNWELDGYKVSRLSRYCGQWIRHSGWYPDRKLRLWDSRKGAWGGVNPHDMFVMEPDAKVGFLSGNLLHYTIDSIQQHIGQINKFSSIRAEELFKKGKKATFYHLRIKPKIKFLTDFIIKRGFLDGYYGYVICKNSAHSTFLRYAKLKEMHRKKQSDA